MSALAFASRSGASRPQESETAVPLGEDRLSAQPSSSLASEASHGSRPSSRTVAGGDPVCPCCGAAVDPLAVLVDPDRQIVVCAGRSVRLTGMELTLVQALAGAFPRTLSREALVTALYPNPADAAGDKIVDVLVSKVRRKLDPLGLVITTQWGVGYTLERPAADIDPSRLRGDRFAASRNVAASTDAAGHAAIADLRARGFRIADIARILKLTYRSVELALGETGRRQ